MFPKILSPSRALVEFITALHLSLSKPQLRHVVNVADALIVCQSTKTLSALNRELVEPCDVYALADFFNCSPWKADQIRLSLQEYLIYWSLEQTCSGNQPPVIFISFDDSLTKKPRASKHFQPVDWHYDQMDGRRKSYGHGLVYLTCRIHIGGYSFTVNWRIYMRERTVRRLNRKRPKDKRLKFRSKFSLAREMLVEILPFIPKGYRVYVLFDSWYASAKLIKFCRRQRCHVICALKHNRNLNGKAVSKHARYKRNKSFTLVKVSSADSFTRYLTYSLRGYLNDIREEVCVIISKRHNRDRFPEYFLCTDLSLDAESILNFYMKRWSCEVDHLYLKVYLGLGDFRMRSVEGISKYFALVFLTLAYLQFRLAKEHGPRIKTLADVIMLHREEHFENLLYSISDLVLREGSSKPILQKILKKENLAVV